MTCNSISSLDFASLEALVVGRSSQEDLITQSTPLALIFSARPAGKSTLKRLWCEWMVRRYLGELSSTTARGVRPHTSPQILLARYTLPEVAIPKSLQHFQMPCCNGNLSGILNGSTGTVPRK